MNEEKKEVVQLHLDDIIPNRFQPREIFNEQELKELALSIKEHGVIQPIIVRSVNGKYEIIAGERRYKASALAGKTTIPAIINNLDDKESSKVALLENLQRKNLNPIEEARTYQKILELDQMTQEDLAKTMGKSQSAVANKLRLLQLTDEVQDALLKEQISERHARTLLRATDPKKQKDLLKEVISKKMSVRLLEEKLTNQKEEINPVNNFINNTPLPPTEKITEEDENEGKIKILNTGLEENPIITNYAEVDKNKDEVIEEIKPVSPLDINNMKQNAQDINIMPSNQSSPLDNLLNLNLSSTQVKINNDTSSDLITDIEEPKSIVNTKEEILNNSIDNPEETKKDYFNQPDLFNINIPDQIHNNETESDNKEPSIIEAKNKIRDLINELKEKEIKISYNEMDFEKAYQLIVKIEK